MKVNVYSIQGEVKEEMELPAIFDEVYRPDLIKRAVLSAQSARVQPWGNDPMAGKRTSAKGWGSGRGTARVPRIKNGSKAAFVPMAIGGRQAHPTRAEKNHHEKINIKETPTGVMITPQGLSKEINIKHNLSDDDLAFVFSFILLRDHGIITIPAVSMPGASATIRFDLSTEEHQYLQSSCLQLMLKY